MSEQADPAFSDDLQARLDAVGVTDEASLRRALDADPQLRQDFEAFLAASEEQTGPRAMVRLMATFLELPDSDALASFWQQMPQEQADDFIAMVEQTITQAEQSREHDLVKALAERLGRVRELQMEQLERAATSGTVEEPLFAFLNAESLEQLRSLLDYHPQLLSEAVDPLFAALIEQYAGDQEALAQIESRRALLQACREQGVEIAFAQIPRDSEQPQQPPAFLQALDRYLKQRRAAEQSESDVSAWRASVEAADAVLAPEFAETRGVNWAALRHNIASAYNTLANALYEAGDRSAAIGAHDRAVALQPDFAMWRRNRASTLIDLGRLDDAADEIAAARALEPDVPQLAQLARQLEQARGSIIL